MIDSEKTVQRPAAQAADADATRAAGQPGASSAGTGTVRTDPARPAAGSAPDGEVTLLCLTGVVKGREFPIGEGRTVIGRKEKEGIQIVLDDAMVSRHHAEIIGDEGEYIIRDLESRNGTKVNGRRVRERVLRNGDRIKIGRSEFRVAINRAAADGGADLGRIVDAVGDVIYGKPHVTALVGAAVFLVAVVFLYPAVRHRGRGAAAHEGREANTSLHRAEEAVREENFSLARELIYQLLVARPNDPEAQALLKKANDEETSLQAMREFQGLKSQGKTEEALQVLRKVPQGSMYYPRAQAEQKSIRETAIEPLLKDAMDFLKGKKWAEARGKLEEVLEKDPENIVALAFLDVLNAWEASPPGKRTGRGREPAKDTDPAKGGTRSELVPYPGVSGRGLHESSASGGDALSLYGRGRLDEAIAHWESHPAEENARERLVLAASVGKYMKKAEDNGRAGQWDEAIGDLTKALGFHEKIAGERRGPIGEKILSALADAYSAKGEECARGDRYSEAFRLFRQALDAQAGSTRAKNGMALLEQKAGEFFRQAYVLEKVNPEEAMVKWNQILTMVPPDNEYYSKSREKIAAYK